MSAEGEKKSIMSKEVKDLAPPRDDLITVEELAQCDGSDPSRPTYVAIKGVVFDVSRNPMYKSDGSYHLFAGKDASRGLACSSLKAEDARPEWYDLSDSQKKTLQEWFIFFKKRYNIVGKVAGATNL
ncbi:hypothetical protein KEM54_003886 [Ascosphaera aggregata]|nr:hypothetical protein KEM54_003886 [Ascosphaera aggregata]